MENTFPALLTYSFFAPLLLRACIALVFAYEAKKINSPGKKEKIWGVVAAILGLGLLLGYLTQLAALAGIAYIALVWYGKEKSVFSTNSTSFLAITLLVSLLLTGAGGFAFDLPF